MARARDDEDLQEEARIHRVTGFGLPLLAFAAAAQQLAGAAALARLRDALDRFVGNPPVGDEHSKE
jgi:hypothetical protein